MLVKNYTNILFVIKAQFSSNFLQIMYKKSLFIETCTCIEIYYFIFEYEYLNKKNTAFIIIAYFYIFQHKN